MAKPTNEPRPARVTREHIAVMEKTPVKQLLRDIPAHYLETMRNLSGANACCRDIDNLSYQAFETEDGLDTPNLAIMECSVCGGKHYRGALGPGKLT